MTRLLLIIILYTGICCSNTDDGPLEYCEGYEAWTLKPLREESVKVQISFPDWDTKLDFIHGDTVSITALDSVEYFKSRRFRILSLMQYGTNIDIETNFEVIKGALGIYSEAGNLTINNLVGRYLVREDYFKKDTVTTFLALFQTDSLAINVIARMTKDDNNNRLFCDFRQVLETIDFHNPAQAILHSQHLVHSKNSSLPCPIQ